MPAAGCWPSLHFLVEVIDQSHLYGVLGWLESHNIEIKRLNPV